MPRTHKQMTPQKVAAIARKAVAVGTPTKEAVFTLNGAVGLAGSLTNLTNIAQGAADHMRIGDAIRLFGIKARLHSSKGGATRLRTLLVRSNKVLTTVDLPALMNAVTDKNLYTVLYDRIVSHSSDRTYSVAIDKMFKNLKGTTSYDTSTSTSAINGIYYLYIVSDDSGGAPTCMVDGNIRVWFKDTSLRKV